MKLGLGSGKSCTVGAWGIAGLVGLLLTQLQAYAAVPAGYTVQTVDIPVNAIVFDPVNSQLLASVPSRAGLGLGLHAGGPFRGPARRADPARGLGPLLDRAVLIR